MNAGGDTQHGPGGGAIRYLDHVGIVVADADAVAVQYLSAGMAIVHDETVTALGVRLVHLAVADRNVPATAQLVQPVAPGPIMDHLDTRGEGPHHVCLAVASLDQMLASLPGERDTAVFTGGAGRPACFLAARPGNALIELIEIGPAPAALLDPA